MATQSISSSPARQAIFAQEKLEKIFAKTYRYLRPYKGAVELAEEVLVWKKPLASALVYIAIHWIFVLYVKSTATLVTFIGNIIFWGLLGDGLWRASTKNGLNSGDRDSRGNALTGRSQRSSRLGVAPRLESVLIQSHAIRGPGELPSFEVVCLWVAEIVMWVDNIWLALRHWSVHEPIIFTIALALPGLVFSLIGKYIPTTVFLYLQVLSVLVVPYIEHHSLRERILAYLSDQYPWVLRKAHSTWMFLKAITVNRDKSDDPELSLAQGVGELQVEHSLHAAFMQVSAIPSDSNELVLPASSHEKGGSVQQDVGGASWPATSQRTQQQVPPAESLTLDSFSGGLETEFPSLTDIDSSLALGQFPSGDYSIMTTIAEQDELSLSGTHDLDPFQDFPDGHSSNRSTQPPHPLSQSHRANPIDPHPSAPPRTTGFDNLGFSMYTSMSGQTGMTSSASTDFVPPPTYQQVEAGSPDAGVTVDWTPGAEEGTGPRRSSTPNMSTDTESWGVKKRPQSGVY